MESNKKWIIVLALICFIGLGIFAWFEFIPKESHLHELSYNEVMAKVENKDSFILLISQTTCSHCMDYKPKLDKVAKEYDIDVYYIEVNLLSTEEVKTFKQHFSYTGTPQTVFVVSGEEKTAASRIDGDASVEKIINKLKSNGFIS